MRLSIVVWSHVKGYCVMLLYVNSYCIVFLYAESYCVMLLYVKSYCVMLLLSSARCHSKLYADVIDFRFFMLVLHDDVTFSSCILIA